ncbi:hypothetical protein K1719_044257 [Acacia pycnantha]|nr:hypothetical protein K1719_044257 [Acacia pycnantha]
MDSSFLMGSTISEPRDDMEFESHEAAYAFYKEYAKSVGFGTAKLSSRRSRASKEFIDAKFSCIRYGNKQQSDDAINPRPSPKIGCKASMHVKRKPEGKWYVYSFVKEHNHELLPAQAHFFRSHRSSDPVGNDVRMRRRKNLTAVSKLFNAYQNVDFLENFLRNLNDKGRSLVLETGQAQLLLELFMHMQEENPKFFYAVDLNEEHRLRNVFWVDAKAACHLKMENDGMTATYSVKDFEDDQNYVVEWNKSNSDICCSCRSFEYKGYLCRHAIVVLQMSGVFCVPPKYVLQRLTNAAMSKHPISERLDEVQTKVRRLNDLCRRAIILGEEGSLSQESYYIALGAIKEALKQCTNMNSVENDARLDALVTQVCIVEEEHQPGNAYNKKVPDPRMTTGNKPARTAGAAREVGSGENTEGNKGKASQLEAVGSQDGFHQMELTDMRQHNVMPVQFHSMVPSLFHTSTQYHNAASTHLPDNCLPR